MRFETAYSYDDILLVPQSSDIETRESIDISTKIPGTKLTLAAPVFVAPMDTVCGPEMAMTAIFSGCSPVLHRGAELANFDTRMEAVNYVAASNYTQKPFGVAIGPTENWGKMPQDLPVAYVCMDTANGHNQFVLRKIKAFQEQFPNIPIMSGNVATGHGAWLMFRSGIRMIRVGVGSGAFCLTRINTGYGLPTFQSILDCDAYLKEKGVRHQVCLIADGGIKNSGDAVKALAAGADAVMIGSYLAGSSHAPGQTVKIKGRTYKAARGMASADAKGNKRYVEGASGMIPYKGSSDLLLTAFLDGIRGGMAYAGAENLSDLRQNAVFRTVTANTVKENGAHGLVGS